MFRWRRLWAALAADLGVEVAPYPGHPTPLEQQMAGQEGTWDRIVASSTGSRPIRSGRWPSWWHTDADLGRELETFTDMTRSRALGFMDLQITERSFTDLFQRLRAERIIRAARLTGRRVQGGPCTGADGVKRTTKRWRSPG